MYVCLGTGVRKLINDGLIVDTRIGERKKESYDRIYLKKGPPPPEKSPRELRAEAQRAIQMQQKQAREKQKQQQQQQEATTTTQQTTTPSQKPLDGLD
jgi:hypothetical protein